MTFEQLNQCHEHADFVRLLSSTEIERFASKESLQACSSWLLQEAITPEFTSSVLRILDQLPLTSALVVSTGIGKSMMKIKKSGANEEIKELATAIIRKWTHISLEKSCTKSSSGILKRERSDTTSMPCKVPRSPVLAAPMPALLRRVRFRDEAIGEQLAVVRTYELAHQSTMRPVSKKEGVQEERATIDQGRREKRLLLEKLKAMAPEVTWSPPPVVSLPPAIKQSLMARGKESSEKAELDFAFPVPSGTSAQGADSPAEPPQRDAMMDPKIFIPNKPANPPLPPSAAPPSLPTLKTADHAGGPLTCQLPPLPGASPPAPASQQQLLSVLRTLRQEQEDESLPPDPCPVGTSVQVYPLLSSPASFHPPSVPSIPDLKSKLEDPTFLLKLRGAIQLAAAQRQSTGLLPNPLSQPIPPPSHAPAPAPIPQAPLHGAWTRARPPAASTSPYSTPQLTGWPQ